MAITYGFYNSMNGDRKYDAVQLSSIFDGVIRDGVFQSIGGYLATKPGTGTQVIVSPGKAWFDHTWTVNDADLPLDISPSDLTLSRYDAVVLETDATKSVRENSIKVIKGTPASDPKKPTLTNEGDVHQHPLAYILVPGGSTEIQVQNIDIMVGKTECPFVTSILESVSIEALLEKWEGEFRVWFDDLQEQMSGDVATNLQNQINKINQTTASPETKAVYNLSEENTPDDIFQAIFAVGDIKISTRTDLGDSWLLCNGETFPASEYPGLGQFTEKKAIDWPTVASGVGKQFYSVKYVNGFWFATNEDGSFYSTSISGPWEKCMRADGNQLKVTEVVYFKGKYYASQIMSDPRYTSILAVSEFPQGPWNFLGSLYLQGVGYVGLDSPLFASSRYLFAVCAHDDTSKYYLLYSEEPETDMANKTTKKIDLQYATGGFGGGYMNNPHDSKCTYAQFGDKILLGKGASDTRYRGVLIGNINGATPSVEYVTNLVTGTASDGIVLDDGGQLGVYSDESTLLYNLGEYPTEEGAGKAYEVGDYIVVSTYAKGLRIYDKERKKYIGKAGYDGAFAVYRKSYAATDGNIVAVNARTPQYSFGVVSSGGDIVSGITPEVSIPGAYAYIRGK